MKKKVRGYIFDIGNVLVHWEPLNIINKHSFHSLAKKNELIRIIEDMNMRVDKGEPFGSVIEEYSVEYPEFKQVFFDWENSWIEMFGPKILETWYVLNELKRRGFSIYALSNFGKETFELACDFYPELKTFDYCFISGHLGLIKPDQRIYEFVEKKLGLKRDELFFIDDRIDNCIAAEKRGWIVHQFTNGKKLINHINSLEITLKN